MKHKEQLLHILQVNYSHRLMAYLFCYKFFLFLCSVKLLILGGGGAGGSLEVQFPEAIAVLLMTRNLDTKNVGFNLLENKINFST